MTAVFGKLQGQTLELKDGLNIIEAPNETGKSTWSAFLLAMLYGINSRERDKAGFIAEKNRYAPWSGTTMNGRLDCRAMGRDITLIRTTRRQAAPLGEFQATFTGTGDSIQALTGQNCGEQLLGISREVFERSAFIRQSNLSISQDAGLERRIAALITSGEEDTSYSEAADTLKKQLNRRRHNKTGLLPTLESELQEIQLQITDLSQLEAQLTTTQQQIESLSARKQLLEEELEQHSVWTAWQKQQEAGLAAAAAQQAEQHAAALRQRILDERIPENETIGRLRGALVNLETTRKAVDKARTEQDEAMKTLLRAEAAFQENPFSHCTLDAARRDAQAHCHWRYHFRGREAAFSVLGSLLLGGTTFGLLAAWQGMPYLTAALWSSGVGMILLLLLYLFLRNWRRKLHLIFLTRAYGTTDPEEISAFCGAYHKLWEARDAAQTEAEKKSAAADTLYNTLSSNEQAILLEIRRFAPSAFDTSTADQLLRECATRRKALAEAENAAAEARMRAEVLASQAGSPLSPFTTEPVPPQRGRDSISGELNAVTADLGSACSRRDHLSGRIHAIGDPVLLRSAAQRLTERLAVLESEYTSIRTAMEVLDSANTLLQNRFSPALGKRAAEIFGELTEHRYSGVVLDRTFHLSTEPAGDTVYRDAQLLSAGAADQLYLATRLAICDLVLPPDKRVPIILDDALTNFDDQRCAAALRWLKQEAARRQILLFSCHSREADFFRNDPEVSVQRLTDAI